MWQAILAAQDPWSGSVFQGLDPEQRFTVILTGMGCLTGIIIALASFIASWANSSSRRRVEAELKREMLDRGMSPDDVVKIIEAASPPEDAAGRWVASWAKCRK